MKKTRKFLLFILVLLLISPFTKISLTQESYVGVQENNNYLWKFSVICENWEGYFVDEMYDTLDHLFPLGLLSLFNVYVEWVPWKIKRPQSHWPFNILAIGSEEDSEFLSPLDNTTITFTPINATAGYELTSNPDYNSFYNGTWYVVNNSTSFLRQTLNLTLSFSPYGIMGVPFAPTSINWSAFIIEFLAVMDSRGVYYDNISAIAKSNGYSLNIPAHGFENNSVGFDIHVRYNSKGVLSLYEFIYGGKKLVKYWLYVPSAITEDDILSVIYGGSLIIGITSIVFIMRWVIKHND